MTRSTRVMMGFRPPPEEWSDTGSGIYLVTGGAGFIGSHLVERLVGQGYHVRVLDNLATGSRANLEQVSGKIEFIEGDIRDRDAVREACRDVVVVFHQAALPSVQRSLEDPHSTNEVNVTGTLCLLDASLRAGVRRLVFASSSSVYGDTPILPKVETMTERPRSPYAASKLAGEKYCLAYSALGLPCVSLRYFNVYGPRQSPDSPYAAVIPRFLDALRNDRQPVIYGSGTQTRDFTFVEDVVQANLQAAWTPDAGGDFFNIGGGRRYSLLDLVQTLGKLTGRAPSPVFQEPRRGDVRDSQAGIQKARRILGFRPEFELEAGLQRLIASAA